MARVVYDHVTKRYGKVVAINDLSLEVADKEFLVIVGPSVSGKTVMLRLLAGLDQVSEGDIYIGDRRVNDLPPQDRDIAMVFQSYALYPQMTAFGNMAFGLQMRQTPKDQIETQVRNASTRLEINRLWERRPRQLSGGERQRVAVGRAIVRKPSVFLMDEPLTNLDAKLRTEARASIKKLHMQLGTTFIYVTHDQIEAMSLGTRIAVLNYGRLEQVDTPLNLYRHPCNLFVAGFIGSPSMNFIKAAVRHDGGQAVLETESFRFPIPDPVAAQVRGGLPETLILGIRPEDIHAAEYQPAEIRPVMVTTRVEHVQQLGHEIILELTAGDQTLVARVDPHTQATRGNAFEVALNVDNVHLFDPATSLSLSYVARKGAAERAPA